MGTRGCGTGESKSGKERLGRRVESKSGSATVIADHKSSSSLSVDPRLPRCLLCLLGTCLHPRRLRRRLVIAPSECLPRSPLPPSLSLASRLLSRPTVAVFSAPSYASLCLFSVVIGIFTLTNVLSSLNICTPLALAPYLRPPSAFLHTILPCVILIPSTVLCC